MPLILDVLTHIDERSAAAGARQLEHQFESGGEAAGIGFGTNLVKGVTSGFAAGDFESMLGVLSSGGMAAKAASHGSAIGVAFAGGITVAAAAGLVSLGVEVGETFEKINRDITLHTGASGRALDDLKAHADALVGSLDSSAKNIGSDMATLATRLQMTAGPALDQLTQHVEMLRDRFGNIDVSALAGAFQNMGVSGAEADNALASLVATARSTDAPLSQLVTNLAANSELFKDMHLSVEQSAAMLGELSAKGVPATTAIMGLQMGMKAAKDQGEDFNTFINRVADSLEYYKRTGNEVAAEDLSLAVGGPRKWTDELAAIQALQAARSSTFAGHGDDLTQLGEQTKTLGNYWDEVQNKIKAALAPPGMSVTDEVGHKMESLIGFIDAHSTDLRNLFETALNAIGGVVEGLGQIAVYLGQHPGLIEAVAVAFGTWEAIKGVDMVLTGIEAVVSWLGIEATTAVATGATVDAAATTTAATVSTAAAEAGSAVAAAAEVANVGMLGLAATMGTIVAQLVLWAPTVAGLLAQGGSAPGAGTAANPLSDKQLAGQRYQQGHGGQMPPGYQQWLQGTGPMPPGMDFHPGETAPQPAGAPAAAPPHGAGPGYTPAAPPAQWTPGPGQSPMTWVPGQGYVPSGVYPGGGPPGDLIAPGDLDPKKKGPRLPTAPEVPYGAGYGAPPAPGESAEQYSAQQSILEKRHEVDEAQARLNQLEQANNADADDIQKAKNALLHAQSDEYKAEIDQTKKHAGDMEEVGAKIDKDFGISKGLPGIAENLTKFLANLAAAPVYGMMMGAQQAVGGGKGSGSGLLGMAGAAGVFGPQYTTAGGGGQQAIGGRGRGAEGGFLSNLLGGGKLPVGAPSDAAPAPGGAAPGGGNANLSAWITQAEAAAGVDASWTAGLQTLIGRESGGNPGAINLTDSNAMAGHPSQGLMQTIPSTFTGYHVPGTSNNINDPVANIAAGIRYIQGRYGGIGGVQQANPNLPPKGYAAGGDISGPSAGTQFGDSPNFATMAPAMGAPTMGSFGAGAVPIMAHEGEHVLTTSDVAAMGGQQNVYQFRAALQAGAGPSAAPRPSTAAGSGATQIGGLGAPQGLGSGFTVTGGGLIGVAESVPATAANMAVGAAIAGAAALYGGAIEDLGSYQDGGAVAAGATGGAGGAGPGAGAAGPTAGAGGVGGGMGTGAPGAGGAGSSGGAGTGASGGGSPGGSVIGAAINIGMQELNEAISKGGQAAGAVVGGLQQTFGVQQFAGTQLAQNSWGTRILGGITGAQPQLPNTAGKGSGNNSPEGVPGMSPMMTPPQEVSPFGPDRGASPGPAGAVASAPAPPPAAPPLPSPSMLGGDNGGAAGLGAAPLYAPGPDDVISRAGAATPSSFNQSSPGSGSGGSSGPAVYIENYHGDNPNSAGQDIGRHVEASYAAQSTPGAR